MLHTPRNADSTPDIGTLNHATERGVRPPPDRALQREGARLNDLNGVLTDD